MSSAPVANSPLSSTWLGHPKGLFLLFGTELWERFSYYAMRAILVLYLVDRSQGQGGDGLGWNEADALSLYGTFTMLVYLAPLLGGWLADHYLGQRKAILIGGALMALGQFTLAMPHHWFAGQHNAVFYLGLALLVAGNGLFKPNISTMVGGLYGPGDHRRDGAFTIFYMGINLGAFASGLLVGVVYTAWGYHTLVDGQSLFVNNYQAGFVAAGIGMLLSLLIQLLFARRYLGDLGTVPSARLDAQRRQQAGLADAPLTAVERDRIKVIFVLGLFTIIFWAGFEQAGGLMNLYADRFVDRSVAAFELPLINYRIDSFELPTAWFQSINPLFIILFAPLFAALWGSLGAREPSSPAKFSLALLLLGLGFLFMCGASLQLAGGSAKASLWWLVGAYLLHTLGELCLSPVGLSMVTKLAPLKLASLFMGLWFFFTGLSQYIAGWVGAWIGAEGDAAAAHAGCVAKGLSSESELSACVAMVKEAVMIDNSLAIFSGLVLASLISAAALYLLANRLIDWMHGAEQKNASN